MAATLSATESDLLTALRTFLLAYLMGSTEVIKGQVNRVAEPSNVNYVVMTPILRERLETNVSTYLDTAPFNIVSAGAGFFLATSSGAPIAVTPQPPGTRAALLATRVTIQLDIHGPLSADNAQIVATLLRDTACCDALDAIGIDAQPLYASDPRQIVFINGEAQSEYRWTIDAAFQLNAFVTIPQEFTNTVRLGLVVADDLPF